MSKRRKRGTIVGVHPAGEDHQVVSMVSRDGPGDYMRQPCQECPWRVENAGSFPPEAFRHSANTAEDGATHSFACHMSGVERPTTCAGFLLRNSANNLMVRIRERDGSIDFSKISDGGAELFRSYRAMAEANGVAADDPALARCRADDE